MTILLLDLDGVLVFPPPTLQADLLVDAVHVVTNQDARRLPALSRVLDDLDVDGVFASCDLGARRPDLGSFEAVLAVLGAAPAECLFVDDSPGDVAGGRAAGLDVVLRTSTPQLRAELLTRGLLGP